MGLRSYLGFGSGSSSSSGSGSSETSTRTSGSSSTGGWFSYDAEAARRQPRETHPASASTDQYGNRVNSVDPYSRADASSFTRRNFGRSYRDE
ncbi:hypothetical protein [Kitasatospora sp. NPDC050543]|uniref:hypothetical protein n=1 Tax=Kitasatospora sp. NPDC050543 TaxID=3364054 RepID=UPI0037B0907C